MFFSTIVTFMALNNQNTKNPITGQELIKEREKKAVHMTTAV